jgi:hypothetical protein
MPKFNHTLQKQTEMNSKRVFYYILDHLGLDVGRIDPSGTGWVVDVWGNFSFPFIFSTMKAARQAVDRHLIT